MMHYYSRSCIDTSFDVQEAVSRHGQLLRAREAGGQGEDNDPLTKFHLIMDFTSQGWHEVDAEDFACKPGAEVKMMRMF